jgi:hypothetical protein
MSCYAELPEFYRKILAGRGPMTICRRRKSREVSAVYENSILRDTHGSLEQFTAGGLPALQFARTEVARVSGAYRWREKQLGLIAMGWVSQHSAQGESHLMHPSAAVMGVTAKAWLSFARNSTFPWYHRKASRPAKPPRLLAVAIKPSRADR